MTTSKTKADKRIFAAAESLSDEIYRQSKAMIQPEDLTCWIRCHVELRPDEQLEEVEFAENVLKHGANNPPKNSIANDLREVLHKPDMCLFELLHEAVYQLRQAKKSEVTK